MATDNLMAINKTVGVIFHEYGHYNDNHHNHYNDNHDNHCNDNHDNHDKHDNHYHYHSNPDHQTGRSATTLDDFILLWKSSSG